eukprot:9482645-Pyramimonas_sp.AAC.1
MAANVEDWKERVQRAMASTDVKQEPTDEEVDDEDQLSFLLQVLSQDVCFVASVIVSVLFDDEDGYGVAKKPAGALRRPAATTPRAGETVTKKPATIRMALKRPAAGASAGDEEEEPSVYLFSIP